MSAPSWTVRDVERLLDAAAVAEIVVLTDQGRFTTDFDLLRSIVEPDIAFHAGVVPEVPGMVQIHLADPHTVYLCSRTTSGKGLYVRATFTMGRAPSREYARSDDPGGATDQVYDDSWVTTRRRS